MKIIGPKQKKRFLDLTLNKGLKPREAQKELLKNAEVPLFFNSGDERINVSGIETTPNKLMEITGIPVFLDEVSGKAGKKLK